MRFGKGFGADGKKFVSDRPGRTAKFLFVVDFGKAQVVAAESAVVFYLNVSLIFYN